MTHETTTQTPYIEYGRLIHAWRNEVKHTFAMVSQHTGIVETRLRALEKEELKPEWSELEQLAKYFYVGVRDRLPLENDFVTGHKFVRHQDAVHFDQTRAGRVQYTYWHRCMSAALPNFKPVELIRPENASRIIKDDKDYYLKGASEK